MKGNPCLLLPLLFGFGVLLLPSSTSGLKCVKCGPKTCGNYAKEPTKYQVVCPDNPDGSGGKSLLVCKKSENGDRGCATEYDAQDAGMPKCGLGPESKVGCYCNDKDFCNDPGYIGTTGGPPPAGGSPTTAEPPGGGSSAGSSFGFCLLLGISVILIQ